MTWQPIETAPKDGSDVDLWTPNNERRTDFHYEKGRWCKQVGYPEVTMVLMVNPTHWMPPPKPPTE